MDEEKCPWCDINWKGKLAFAKQQEELCVLVHLHSHLSW